MRPYVTADPKKRMGCFISHYMLWLRCVKYDEPIIIHDASCKGSINYLNLAREVLQKNSLTRIEESDKIIVGDNEL